MAGVGNKRTRDEYEDPEAKERTVTDRLKALLVRIGERSQSSLASNLDMLAKALQVDIAHHQDYIVETLLICVEKLCVKTSIYGTLVGLVNSVEEDFGAAVVKKFREKLLEALSNKKAQRDIHRVRMFVRFFSCLQNANVLLGSDLLKVFKCVLKIAQQDLTRNQKDNIVHVVMSALPWAGKNLNENYPEGLTQIMSALEIYMDQRGFLHSPEFVRTFKNESVDYLVELWEGCKAAAREEWNVGSILEPHTEFSRLKKAHQHPLNWPTKVIKWTKSDILSTVNFGIPKILDQNVIGDQVVKAIERCIVSEYVADLFRHFSLDIKMCTEQLLNLQASFEAKYLIVEAITANMLALPKTNQPGIFYTRLIIELFKRQPRIWPKVIGAMINTLFHNIEKVDVEARDRFAMWFGQHLCNFNHQWPWNNWAFTAELQPQSAKRVFVHQVLDESVNLAYYDRVSKTVPPEMKSLMPSKHTPKYRFSKRSFKTPGTEETGPKSIEDLASELLRMINQRLSPDDIETFLDTHVVPSSHGQWAPLDLIFLTILHAGRQSYSHVLSFITTYKVILKNLVHQEIAQIHVMELVAEYWQNSNQHLWILTDKMHAFGLVSASAIVKWVFAPATFEKFYMPVYARIVKNAVHRTLQVRHSLEAAICKTRTDLANAPAPNEDLETFGESTSNTPLLQNKLRKLEKKLQKQTNQSTDLFLAVFNGMHEQIANLSKTLKKPESDFLYQSLKGRLVQFIRQNKPDLEASRDTLAELVFNDKAAPVVVEVWKNVMGDPPIPETSLPEEAAESREAVQEDDEEGAIEGDDEDNDAMKDTAGQGGSNKAEPIAV